MNDHMLIVVGGCSVAQAIASRRLESGGRVCVVIPCSTHQKQDEAYKGVVPGDNVLRTSCSHNAGRRPENKFGRWLRSSTRIRSTYQQAEEFDDIAWNPPTDTRLSKRVFGVI